MANTYLTRNFTATGNRKIYTTSCWVKRSQIGATQMLISADLQGDASYYSMIYIDGSDKLVMYNVDSGSNDIYVQTNRLFRDTSAWYHIVIAFDTTQGTASNRIKFYVNGVQETSMGQTTYPSLDSDNTFFNRAYRHNIGNKSYNNANYFSGSLSHFNFIDGTAYDATAFGEYDANGVWTIKTSPSVTYGTNGFFILKDGNSVTDQSGNTNNFTVGGGTLTNTEDSPSNVFATLNPLIINNFLLPNMTYVTTTEGNNTLTGTSASNNGNCYSTLGASSGKFYCEVKVTLKNGGYPLLGIMPEEGLFPTSSSIYGMVGYNFSDTVAYQQDGNKRINSSTSSFGDTYGLDDIIGIAMDLDNGAVYFSKNGIFQNSGNPTSGASKTGAALTFTANNKNYFFGGTTYNTDGQIKFNFGNGYFGTTAVASAGTNASGIGIFEFDVPTGFTSLSTKGLNL